MYGEERVKTRIELDNGEELSLYIEKTIGYIYFHSHTPQGKYGNIETGEGITEY